jgi:hypothetical protein
MAAASSPGFQTGGVRSRADEVRSGPRLTPKHWKHQHETPQVLRRGYFGYAAGNNVMAAPHSAPGLSRLGCRRSIAS